MMNCLTVEPNWKMLCMVFTHALVDFVSEILIVRCARSISDTSTTRG